LILQICNLLSKVRFCLVDFNLLLLQFLFKSLALCIGLTCCCQLFFDPLELCFILLCYALKLKGHLVLHELIVLLVIFQRGF